MPIIWQISAIHLDKKTLLSGVLLKRSPFTYNKKISQFKNFLKVTKSYFVPAYANKEISISIDGKTHQIATDNNGGFSLVVDFLIKNNPEIRIEGIKNPLKIIQRYPVIFSNSDGDFDVISDIDDTIIVSKTAEALKRMRILAFKIPQRRKTIPYTYHLFEIFKEQHARVIYVSKSESNLFALISAFIEHNKLPKGSLILTSYLKLIQLLNPKKGRNYKLNTIKFIIENSSKKSFVLLGDDSQKDMNIYSDVVRAYPNRILKIYIRQTGLTIRKHQKKMWESLKQTGVNATYFNSEDEVNKQNEIKFFNKQKI